MGWLMPPKGMTDRFTLVLQKNRGCRWHPNCLLTCPAQLSLQGPACGPSKGFQSQVVKTDTASFGFVQSLKNGEPGNNQHVLFVLPSAASTDFSHASGQEKGQTG